MEGAELAMGPIARRPGEYGYSPAKEFFTTKPMFAGHSIIGLIRGKTVSGSRASSMG
jgi:hypothetical protein